MDLRQLSALMAVADNGSFSAAAEALATVQSNISSHIARLEKELGATLVDRSAGTLTEEGEVVLTRARRIDDEMKALVAEIAGLHHEVVGTVRVGMIGTTARWLAPQLIALTTPRHPQLRLVVAEGTTSWLEPQLISGRLDLAVLQLPVSAIDLAMTPLFEEDLALVVAHDDPLAGKGKIDMEELATLPLLLPLPGTAFRNELESTLRLEGLSLLPKMEIDGVRLIASMVFDGHGPAVLPATAVPRHMRDSWRLVPITGLSPRLIGVARRRRAWLTTPARALLELLDELVAKPDALPDGLHLPVSSKRA